MYVPGIFFSYLVDQYIWFILHFNKDKNTKVISLNNAQKTVNSISYMHRRGSNCTISIPIFFANELQFCNCKLHWFQDDCFDFIWRQAISKNWLEISCRNVALREKILLTERGATYSATHSKNCIFIAQSKLRTVRI